MHLPHLPTAILFTLLLLLVANTQSHAFTATDFNSSIQVNEIDIAPTNGPTPSPSQRTTPPSLEQDQVHLPSVVQNRSLDPTKGFFSLSLTSVEADFGIIDPTNPVIRTQDLRLNPGSSNGFSLFLYENHPLQVEGTNHFIPDTTCDDGKCTETSASAWENTLTYGFGFRCDSEVKEDNPCSLEFENQQTYKQFADVTKQEPGTELLNGQQTDPIQARITYKLNVAGTQTKGVYENTLVFIASPRF